jgi:hypothetical protein
MNTSVLKLKTYIFCRISINQIIILLMRKRVIITFDQKETEEEGWQQVYSC